MTPLDALRSLRGLFDSDGSLFCSGDYQLEVIAQVDAVLAPPPPSVSTDKGSRPQEAVPTEGPEAAVVGDDGWLTHDGGPNPVPGRFVDIRHRCGVERRCVPSNLQSSGRDWWKHELSPVFAHTHDIIAYRLVPQPADGCSSNEGAEK